MLLELLTEVEIEQGAPEAALTKARRLAALGASSSCDVTVARGERALGRALVATGEPDGGASASGAGVRGVRPSGAAARSVPDAVAAGAGDRRVGA